MVVNVVALIVNFYFVHVCSVLCSWGVMSQFSVKCLVKRSQKGSTYWFWLRIKWSTFGSAPLFAKLVHIFCWVGFMVDVSKKLDGTINRYKPTYEWGAPSCRFSDQSAPGIGAAGAGSWGSFSVLGLKHRNSSMNQGSKHGFSSTIFVCRWCLMWYCHISLYIMICYYVLSYIVVIVLYIMMYCYVLSCIIMY